MELYDVSYSGRVHEAMRAIVVRAQRAGLGFQVFEALRQLDRLLKVYPHFGQPLRDLSVTPAQLWIGVISPIVIRYIINEDRRQVLVVSLPQILPRSGF